MVIGTEKTFEDVVVYGLYPTLKKAEARRKEVGKKKTVLYCFIHVIETSADGVDLELYA